MTVEIPHTGTEFVANSLTFTRGSAADVVSVGVYHTTDPTVIPDVSDFAPVRLVTPSDPLGAPGVTDVLSLIGPRNGDVALAPGDYQRWVLVSTELEDVMRRPDTITIL